MERAQVSASPLKAETTTEIKRVVTTEIKRVVTTQTPQLFTTDYELQDHAAQLDMYLWTAIIGILIGIGLVLLVSWVLRLKLGYILGMIYFLMICQTGQLSQHYIFQQYYKNTGPVELPYIKEVDWAKIN